MDDATGLRDYLGAHSSALLDFGRHILVKGLVQGALDHFGYGSTPTTWDGSLKRSRREELPEYREREQQHPERLVSFPPKPARKRRTA